MLICDIFQRLRLPRHEEWVLTVAEALNFAIQSTFLAGGAMGSSLHTVQSHNKLNIMPTDSLGFSPLLAQILLLLVFGYAGGSMGPSVDAIYFELAKVNDSPNYI